MGRYEVTNIEYVIFLNSFAEPDKNCNGKPLGRLRQIAYNKNEDEYYLPGWPGAYEKVLDISRYPVINITWYGAIAYCNWLSIKQGLEPAYDLDTWELISDDYATVEGYRLPSHNEHKYAAMGGQDYEITDYPGSDDYNEVLWCKENSDAEPNSGFAGDDSGTHQVAQKNPNEAGVLDIGGNVSEYVNNYSTTDSSDGSKWYGHTGGNWDRASTACDISGTGGTGVGYMHPENNLFTVGFRIVRTKQ